MHKFIKTLLVAVLLILPGKIQAGTLTLTTYYQAPIAAYSVFRLNPIADLIPPCGTGLFYINAAGIIMFCDGTSTFQSLSPVWAQSGDNIYLQNLTANAAVGVGTNTPAARLHIHKKDGSTFLLISDIATGNQRLTISTSGTLAGADVNITSQDNKELRFAGKLENPADDITITSLGSVGIGTSAPQAVFHVNGNIATTSPAPVNIDHAARKDYVDFVPIILAQSIPAAGVCPWGGVDGTEIKVCHNNIANCPGAWSPVSNVACYTNSPPTWFIGPWGPCTVTCGGGTRTRIVECQLSDGTPVPDINCPVPKPPDSEPCNTMCCPVDGGWSAWSPWSACDGTCNQDSTRTCDNPPDSCGGAPCVGSPTQTRSCYPDTWVPDPWSPCDNCCGTGTQTRTVNCSGACCDPATQPKTSRGCYRVTCCPVCPPLCVTVINPDLSWWCDCSGCLPYC